MILDTNKTVWLQHEIKCFILIFSNRKKDLNHNIFSKFFLFISEKILELHMIYMWCNIYDIFWKICGLIKQWWIIRVGIYIPPNNTTDQLKEESFYTTPRKCSWPKQDLLILQFICYFHLIYLGYFDFH